MTLAELERLAEELGIDVVGAGPAEPYAETERHIRERRSRGLFADMRFTMARPEVSCHPEALLPNAKTVVSAALCYYVNEGPIESAAKPPVRDAASPHRGPVEGVWGNRAVPPADLRAPLGRLPRYTWFDAYADLREKLDALGRRLGGAYRVLVDENDHVDREGAVRAGVGFYGKNTMLITRRHGSWVVLGTLVTDVEVEASPRLTLDCGSCTLCIDACPTGALDDPGVLDSTRCLSYWTQAPAPIPEEYRAELGSQVYGCDICQDVCPWNRGIEKRRGGAAPAEDLEPHVSLVKWLEASDEELRDRYERLYFPRKDPRYLRRNALVALGNSGEPEHGAAAEPYAEGDDPLLREHAEWALARLGRKT